MTLIALLAILAYQDFKERLISIFLFIGLYLVVVAGWFFGNIPFNIHYVVLNLVILTIQCGIVFIYLAIVRGVGWKILNRYLGLGDILLWVLLCLMLESTAFILFQPVSLIISLGVYLLLPVSRQVKQIPLAGLQATVLIATLLLKVTTFWDFNLFAGQMFN